MVQEEARYTLLDENKNHVKTHFDTGNITEGRFDPQVICRDTDFCIMCSEELLVLERH